MRILIAHKRKFEFKNSMMPAWKEQRFMQKRWFQTLFKGIPVFAGASVFVVALWVWQAVVYNEDAFIHKKIDLELENLRQTFTHQLDEHIWMLERMGKRWEAQGGTPQAQWLADAKNYYAYHKSYQALEWVDADFDIRWGVPSKENSASQNRNLALAEQQPALEKARNQKETTLSPTFDLAQGGKGLVVYVPLFVQGQFDGFLRGVFSIRQWLESILSKDMLANYAIRVFEDKRLVFEHTPPEFANQALWPHEQSFFLQDQEWKIEIAHTEKLVSDHRSNLAMVVLFLGILSAFLVALTLFFFQNSKFQQHQLLQQHQELQTIVQAFPDIYLWFDHQGRVLGYQGRGRFYGDPKTYMGKSYKDVYPPEITGTFEEVLEEVVRTGRPAQAEFCVSIGGEMRWREGRMMPLGSDRLLVIVRDVTEQKKAQKALEESRYFAETLANYSPNLIYVVELATGKMLYTNRHVAEQLDYSKEEAAAMEDNPVFFIHGEDLGRMKQRIDILKNLTDDALYQYTIRAQHADGTWHWILNQERIFMRDEQGKPTQFIGTAQDVTPVKRAEIEAQKAKEIAESANRAKSEFLAAMSHEIRTPLNAVMGMAELLEETRLDAEQQNHVASIITGGDTLLYLINDILDLSKIEASQLELEEAPFDLADIVERQMQIMVFSAQRKGLVLTHHFGKDTPFHLIGDAVRLRQILFNLLGNAIKFTQSGSIKLDIQTVSATEDSCRLHFSVQDTGMGIPPEKQSLIFEQFSQADASTTREFGGTGLGLSICRHLVDLMGGEMDVQSRVGAGSTFSFILPFKPNPDVLASMKTGLGKEPPAAPLPSSEKNPLPPFHVLLVEDDPTNQEILMRQLERMGGIVKLAENGAQALEWFQTHPYDFVFMDMQMPIMDGYTATAKLREWEQEQERPPTPVVALTAYSVKESLQKCLDVGCDDYLTKPIKRATLLQKVEELLKYPLAAPTQAPAMPAFEGRQKPSYRVEMPEIFADLIPEIMKNKHQQCQKIREALAQKDFQTIGFISHQLKGSHHMERVNELGKALEEAAKHEQVEAIQARLAELEDFLEHVEFETT